MHTKHNLTSLLCALALLAATASHAAALLTLNYSGTFGTGTTLGVTALADNTPFSFAATFDPTAPIPDSIPGAAGFFATSFTILINSTTYTATTPSALTVFLADPRYLAPSYYAVGLNTGPAPKPFVLSSFCTGAAPAYPAFNANTPTPTLFSDFFLQDVDNGFPIALNDVPGGLVVNDLVGPAAASLSLSAVPEPSEWTAISFAVLGLAYAAKRRLTKAAH